MSLQIEKLDKSMAKLTIEVSAEEFEKAVGRAYQNNKGKMSIPGFRKGKAPRQLLEKMYGETVFFDDAINDIIPKAYSEEVSNCDLDIVSQPKIEVVQIGKGKSFIFTAEVALKPEVELGDYKSIRVEKPSCEVTQEDIDAELEDVRKQNARTIPVDDRPVADGDIAVIDYEGFVDGVAFEGGEGIDYYLTIGSHTFVDTFEEQLIGKNIGDQTEVNVTFPEEYHSEELKGKAAKFEVTIKEIKRVELPELDDDFAQDVSEFDTLSEYMEDIRKNLAEEKEEEAKTEVENKTIEALIDISKMEVPEPMVDLQVRQMADSFARRIQAQGISMERYFQFTGLTRDKFLEQIRPQAEQRIKSRLALEALAKAENFEITEEDIQKEIERLASSYKMEADELKKSMSEAELEAIKEDVGVQKAVEYLTENCVE